jgi:hypothetical protein
VCDQCEYLVINGIGCHETGCPNQGSIECESCGECVRAHNVHYANDWDGLEYCKPCAEYNAQLEADDDADAEIEYEAVIDEEFA